MQQALARIGMLEQDLAVERAACQNDLVGAAYQVQANINHEVHMQL